tara:strand:- start:353 stop:619 length:267 start_codon:yes stop_codon:yes gene_type:complete
MNIKKQLQKGNVKFNIKGSTEYRRGEDGKSGNFPKIFEVGKEGGAIWNGFNGMNVNKWGPTCVTLYTFDLLGKKSVGKINYSQITLVK